MGKLKRFYSGDGSDKMQLQNSKIEGGKGSGGREVALASLPFSPQIGLEIKYCNFCSYFFAVADTEMTKIGFLCLANMCPVWVKEW